VRLEPVLAQAYNFFDWLFSTGAAMPCYEFYCEDCNKPFETILTLAEYEKDEIKCPKCGGEHVHQEAAAFFAVTSKKS
jgi:putative FmdB family regulatory protein